MNIMVYMIEYLWHFIHSHHRWEGISFMWEMVFEFLQIFTFCNPLSQKKRFLRKCLSLSVGRILGNSIELSFDILFSEPQWKYKFVYQQHPTKIVKIRAVFVFLKKNSMEKSKIPILVPDSSHNSLLTIILTFFD